MIFGKRIWSTWNWTWYKFLRENMQAGIYIMEDIHELMLWNDTCAFRVHMTAVLIKKTSLFRYYWWFQNSDEFKKKSCYPPLKNVVSRLAYACWGVSRSFWVRWVRNKALFYIFSQILQFFLTFFRKFQNMSIFSSIIANTCIWVCKHEIDLGRKIWKIQVSCIDRSNILCTSLQKPFQLF